MRLEKKLFLAETVKYLETSKYFFLTNYKTITVKDTSELREALKAEEAKFHVIKNNNFRIAASKLNILDLNKFLNNETALIIGNKNPSSVAKIITKFYKTKHKLSIKCGFIENCLLSSSEVLELSKLPDLPEMQSKLLSIFNASIKQLLVIMKKTSQELLQTLQAKSLKQN